MAGATFNAGFDFKRLPGGTREGSQAFWRKITTQDARLAMAGIIKQYETMLRNLRNQTPEAMEEALKPIFKQAQYYVPEKTGALWESGTLTSGIGQDGRPVARIQFGNEEAWYAAMVHEFTWLHHEAPTRAKYLQAAMEEGMGNVLPVAAASLRPVVEGKVTSTPGVTRHFIRK